MIRLFIALAILAFAGALLWESLGQDMGIADAVMRLWPL